ncbi:Glycosyltransferase, group 2 family protein [Micrococcus luteus]|uniref:glycosyltransferase family 2 protein n=1 Tax=Micrococcus luteus TaxID=1270 RepID=UPI0004476ED6|nr:glycosyltransferase family A protein [Micrococcus luteus]EZP31053.1 Glycosyltransferase, group 2 family protein [Micrococcus luteus]
MSVIIPAFDAARVLGLQLDALASQEGAPPFEVVVVDNNSADGTAALVRGRARNFPVPLRIVTAVEHQGPGYARNAGAAAARAELLMFADADDVVSKWWVRNGVRAFESSALWSGGARLMTDDEMRGGIEQIRAAMGDEDRRIDVVPGDLSNAFPVLMGGDFGATRQTYERLGGFDVSLGGVYEDNDLAVRAHRAGVPVDEAPDVRIAFRGKWDVRFRARLARRSAHAHAIVADRYGLAERSHFPSPWRELPRAVGSAVLMAAGRKDPDWMGVWIRMNTAFGHGRGRLVTRLPGAAAPAAPEIGVGLTRQGEPQA